MIKNYFQFIKEADEPQAQAQTEPTIEEPTKEAEKSETDSAGTDKFPEVKDQIKSMIEETIEKQKFRGDLKSFLDGIKEQKDVSKVLEFINDSDVYDFYLKWRNDIDELLNDINYFDDAPTKNDAFGLYEYVIKGTERAFFEFIKSMK
jgi:hypothetical protein